LKPSRHALDWPVAQKRRNVKARGKLRTVFVIVAVLLAILAAQASGACGPNSAQA